MSNIAEDLQRVKQSLKMREVEETYDIYFSRLLGFYIAKLSEKFKLTPTNVTVLSMISGIIGGGLFFWQDHLWVALVASLFVTLAGLFDSADGQLARMTGQSTDFGRVLDGVADTVVFIACYVGACAYSVLGPGDFIWIIPIAMVAGYLHNFKNCVYDLYKSEMLYYGGGFEELRMKSREELKEELLQHSGWKQVLFWFYTDYLRRQLLGSSRTKYMNQLRACHEQNKTEFSKVYIKYQRGLLRGWAWVGGLNVHRWGIILGCLFVRFDIYLYLVIITFPSMLIMNYLQLKADKKVLAYFEV